MLKTITTTLSVLALLCLPAIARAQMPGANDPDAKELAAYTITVPTLNKVVQATRLLAEGIKSDPRFLKQQSLKADIKKLQEKEEPSEADSAKLEKLQAELEQLEQGVFGPEDAKTLAQMAARIQREPVMAKALAGAGLDAREYAKFTLAYFQAAMIAGMMKSGMIKEVPKELAASVNMDNVKFVQEHEAEIAAFAKALEGLRTP
jgi:hypothetical protein